MAEGTLADFFGIRNSIYGPFENIALCQKNEGCVLEWDDMNILSKRALLSPQQLLACLIRGACVQLSLMTGYCF